MSPASRAVEELITKYYKLVFHTIYGLTGNWEESQDLTQDTFQQALKGIDAARVAVGEQFHAKAWLLRIALNVVRMQQRRRALFRFIPFSSWQERGRRKSQTLTQRVVRVVWKRCMHRRLLSNHWDMGNEERMILLRSSQERMWSGARSQKFPSRCVSASCSRLWLISQQRRSLIC